MASATEYLVDRENPDIAVGHRPREAVQGELDKLVELVGEDLRDTQCAVAHVERWRAHALETAEKPVLTREELAVMAADPTVIEGLDTLTDTLAGLRRRLAAIARRLR